MHQAVSFCQQNKYSEISLWTFEGLESARHLYEKFNFEIAEQRYGDQWGTGVNEQKYQLFL